MATASITRIRRTRATTQTVTPAAGQSRTAPQSKQLTALELVQINAAHVKDPANLARVLAEVQSNVVPATLGARTAVTNQGGVVFKNRSFTSGVAQLVVHNLGRQVHGYQVLRTRVGAGATIALQEVALPAGYDETIALNLKPSATGTGDLWIY